MTKKYYQTIMVLLATGILISLVSCNPAKKYEKDEQNAIDSYLATNNTIVFDHEASGLYFHEVSAGNGIAPALGDTAYVRYTGMYMNGTVFDSNTGTGREEFIFRVGYHYAIDGFDEGVTYMKAGGKATLVIPSALAYGTQGYYTIPGYTPLLFDIELVKVVKGPTK